MVLLIIVITKSSDINGQMIGLIAVYVLLDRFAAHSNLLQLCYVLLVLSNDSYIPSLPDPHR